MEGKAELDFFGHFDEIDEDFHLNKTSKAFTSEYSEKNSLLREEEGTKTAKSLLKTRSFEQKKEFPKRITRKTKSFSTQFPVNIGDSLVNDIDINVAFDAKNSLLSPSHSNEDEISFLSNDESFTPSEKASNVTRLKHFKPEDKISDQFSLNDKEDHDLCSIQEQIEPAYPIFLQFNDVNHKVRFKGKKNYGAETSILHGVSGSVCPGEILALMGPSGGGKTTLLNLLSGRVKSSGGTITYNDHIYTKSLKRRIGFVLQDDVVFPHLTVKETLTYAALLRLPNTLSRQQKEDRAMNIIIELGLERCQNTMVGGSFVRGISGGERKRVCIGNEIILNPSLLFLDEPTSGLDSTAALRIIQMLHDIAQAGKTVITTIHQPSSRLFSRFDKLILLGKGCSLYFGQASEAMLYFSTIGCSPLISMNPAEFLIDLANGNIKDKSVPSELEDKLFPDVAKFETIDRRPSPDDVHEYLVGAYKLRTWGQEKMRLPESTVVKGRFQRSISYNSKEAGATWCEQVSILFKRGFKERCHHCLSRLHIFQVISCAVIVGLLWWHSDASSQRRFQDQAGLLFFISVFWAFLPLFAALHTFPQERAMLAKERSVDMYKLSAYVVARNTSNLPLDLILPVVFLIMVYFMANLRMTFTAFSLTLLTVFLSIIASQGLGLAIGAAVMDVKKATTLASITIMAFMLSGGFYIQRVPAFMSWLRYISLNYHTYRLLLRIQYGCDGGASGLVMCNSPFIKAQRLNQGGGTEVGAILAMIIVYRILAYIFLRRMQ